MKLFTPTFIGKHKFCFGFYPAILLTWLITTPAFAEETPFGLTERLPWTTSRLTGSPTPPPPYTVERAFPQLTFESPVFIAEEPGTQRILVAELSGKIFAFDGSNPETDQKELFFAWEREIYAFSLHPNYVENGTLFIFSPRDPAETAETQLSRVSRFTTNLDQPRIADSDSEQIIIEWTAGGHNGGEAIIGPDGYLYIATGDGTSGSDLNKTGQGVDDLFSVMMRIDVEHPSEDKPYSIPPDNPFLDFPGARPEIWAFGFRNPWRFSFDAETGDLWVGDVGQDLWEMIWKVQRGGNYGWSVNEGDHPFHPNQEVGPGPILPPLVEHHHTECRSITGGYVYRGSKFPELFGAYIYGDYEYGKIWGVRCEDDQVVWQQELANTALRLPTFGVTKAGDILTFDYMSGEIYRLAEATDQSANKAFPRTLTETGLFASVADHQLAAGIIPYSVNVAQWCDRADKQRFFGIPETSNISFVEDSGGASTWGFEDGTVLAETISLPLEVGNTASRRRLETRILMKQENHWLGYSYLWNDAQDDAILVAAEGQEIPLVITDPTAPGGTRRQTWRVPSRNECMVCHSRAAGFVLGLRTAQINCEYTYNGHVDNQLRSLNHIEIFSEPLPKQPEEYDSFPDPRDPTADLSLRARAYLHVNCSVCHVADGGGNAKMEMSYYQELSQTKLLQEAPLHGTFGIPNGKIITPGDPYSSILLFRLSKRGRGRMPHVGSNLTDTQGLKLLHDWILQLPPAEESTPLQPQVTVAATQTALQALSVTADSSADDRAEILSGYLSSTRTAFMVSQLLRQDPSLHPLRAEIIQLGTAHAETNVRDLFEDFLPEEKRLQRLGDQIDTAALLKLAGDPDRGRHLFLSATSLQCKNCHRVQGTGGIIGPDLSGIGIKSKPHELLESLIDPSKKIDPKFATHRLVTSEGKFFTGILISRSEENIVLNVFRDGQGKPMSFPIQEVEEISPVPKSLMPERLLKDLTPQQAADLLAFLSSLRRPPEPQ